jgi:hypothetical protein
VHCRLPGCDGGGHGPAASSSSHPHCCPRPRPLQARGRSGCTAPPARTSTRCRRAAPSSRSARRTAGPAAPPPAPPGRPRPLAHSLLQATGTPAAPPLPTPPSYLTPPPPRSTRAWCAPWTALSCCCSASAAQTERTTPSVRCVIRTRRSRRAAAPRAGAEPARAAAGRLPLFTGLSAPAACIPSIDSFSETPQGAVKVGGEGASMKPGMPCTTCLHPTVRRPTGCGVAALWPTQPGPLNTGQPAADSKLTAHHSSGPAPPSPCTHSLVHPTPIAPAQCKHAPSRQGVMQCPECQSTIVLDPVSGPKWRLDCRWGGGPGAGAGGGQPAGVPAAQKHLACGPFTHTGASLSL